MADIDDRWYSTGPDGERKPTARHGTGKRWAARWRDANGKQCMRSFERKLDAANFLTGLRADMMRGSYIDPRQGKITLRSYAEQRWLPSPNGKSTSSPTAPSAGPPRPDARTPPNPPGTPSKSLCGTLPARG